MNLTIMDLLLVLVLSIFVIILLALLGTYKDLASRSGIPVVSRQELLVPPTAYAIIVLSTFVPYLLLVIYPLFHMDIATAAALVVPLCLLLFCLLILTGSFALWLAYQRKQTLVKCLLLSARMMLVPVIDSFWSSVAVFITIEYVSVILLGSVAFIGYNLATQADLASMIETILTPGVGTQTILLFPLIGVPIAYYILKKGPSETLSKYYLITGYAVLIISFIASAYLYSKLGQIAPPILGFLVFFGVVVCFINQAISRLYHSLRVAGVFGLELIGLSLFLLLATYEAEKIRNFPLFGQTIYALIPSFVWSIGYELGIIGFISGVLILLVARKQPEKGQVMTRAMAITIAVSSFFPLLSLAIPIPYIGIGVGAALGVLLIFLLVAPFYVVTVSIIRIYGAVKTLVGIGGSGNRCSSCGRMNKPQANFCGKCGNRL